MWRRTGLSDAARDGVAAKGPSKLWQSDPIPTQKEGGFGSVVVVGSNAYLLSG